MPVYLIVVFRREKELDPEKLEVVHCRILHQSSGFGFAEPYFIYETLKELVLHYRRETLAEHNEMLNLTLMYPVRMQQQYGTYVD